MGKKHRKSHGRHHRMNLAEALMAMQAGRCGVEFGVGPRRARREREFSAAALKLVILKLVEEEPRRGDELIEAIADLAKGRNAPGPEIVYPTLSLLEDSGLIEAEMGKGAGKRYRLTDAGRAELDERSDEIEPLMRRATRAERMDGSEEREAVKTAMRSLAGSLAQRMVTKGVDDDLLREVASIVDDAADRIRQL